MTNSSFGERAWPGRAGHEGGRMRGYAVRGLVVGLALAVAGAWTLAGAGAGGAASVADALRLLELAEERYAEIQDYTAILLTQERIGGILRPEHAVLLKFARPFSVYLRWLDGPAQGREGLFVAGAWGDRFLVQEKQGLASLVTAAISPRDPRILERSRHPVTNIGLGRLLEIVGEDARRAARNGVLAVVDHGIHVVAGRPARQVEGILPRDPEASYYCHRVILAFDLQHHLPLRVVVYDWAGHLVEQYTYTDLRLNPGFAPRDFDPANPDYGFSRIRLPLPG